MIDLWANVDSRLWSPTSVKEAQAQGWTEPDVVLFSGDAYIDHPAFGAAIIARILEREGLKVAIVPQPNWKDDLRDFRKFGKPRLFFAVTAGNMDSMVNHYTANKRLRHDDAYTPGNRYGARPDYALSVYSRILKSLYPETPVIIGGIEASLRRLCHYDYWSDSLKPSVLIDSKADLLFYGMAEKSLIELLSQLKTSDLTDVKNIPQTAWVTSDFRDIQQISTNDSNVLHSYEDCQKNKILFGENFKHIETESNKLNAKTLIEQTGSQWIVVNPPFPPLTTSELDEVYSLPFTRLPHPRYRKKEAIPAFEMIRNSVTIHRGCFGGCSFCTISAHQGKFISSRSESSVLTELQSVIDTPGFAGHISDLGGPSANMYKMMGIDLKICSKCSRPSCIFPKICNNLDTNHKSLTELYRKVRKLKGINKLTIGSGIRYDLFLSNNEKDKIRENIDYLRELIRHHVSGRLKVAPENSSDTVLTGIRKPSFQLFRKLWKLFYEINKAEGLNQQLIPYFISSLPGSSPESMAELVAEAVDLNLQPEQIQDFTPTPMTLASVIFHTGTDPYSGKKVFVARTKEEKLNQRMFFFWYKKEYQQEIRKQLRIINRPDLEQKIFRNQEKTNLLQKDFKGSNSRFRSQIKNIKTRR